MEVKVMKRKSGVKKLKNIFLDGVSLRFDLRKVREADLVLVNLKDLDKSLGTSDEIFYAYMRGIPVIGFLETEDELSETEVQETVHPWKYEQIDRIETGEDAMAKAITYIIGYYEEQR